MPPIARKIFRLVKRTSSLAGYASGGNCFETSISTGVLLAREGIVARLVKGVVRGITHYWLETDFGRLDPTKRQFPGLREQEYPKPVYCGMDFEQMVILLGLEKQ